MDRRADTSLRRAWEANAAALGPALASACVARNTAAWTSRLLDHLASSSKSRETQESLQVIGSAVAYLADAAIETVRASAKTGALINASRRAVWLKTWRGDLASKNRLCAIPFEGSLLFGTALDQALARSSEKGNKFPSRPRANRGKFFRPNQRKNPPPGKKSAPGRRWGFGKDKPKSGILFSSPKPGEKDPK